MCVWEGVLRAFMTETLPIAVCPATLPGVSPFPGGLGIGPGKGVLCDAAVWSQVFVVLLRLSGSIPCFSFAFGGKHIPGGLESVKVLFWPWDVVEVLGMRLLVLFYVLTPKWGWSGSAACTA